ncbi:MAG: hypothetical protein U0892_09855 [Pirellulales bacterium]
MYLISFLPQLIITLVGFGLQLLSRAMLSLVSMPLILPSRHAV